MGAHNTSNGDAQIYFQEIWRWNGTTWSRSMYFGNKDDSVGQTYTVTTIVLDQTVAAQLTDTKHSWTSPAFPPGSQEVDVRTVTRIAGPGTGC